MKSILAFGNPLLDLTISSQNYVRKLVEKYNLQKDGQKEISQDEMRLLSKDIQGYETHLSAGGCCQNSLRVLQWILHGKCQASIFGSVGNDTEAKLLQNFLQSDGLQTRYVEQPALPTGKTIALVDGIYRSLVAHIGAAEVFPLQTLVQYKNFNSIFDSSDIIFLEAYFLTNRFETAKYVVDLAKKKCKIVAFNLGGEYIFEVIPEEIKYMVKHSDILFGNCYEFDALKVLLNYSSRESMAADLLQQEKLNTQYSKTLIITNGDQPVTCFYETEKIEFLPPLMKESDIKDTVGAGDAFIGGYLAGLCTSKTLQQCTRIAFYAASNILKQHGCTIPKYKSTILTSNDFSFASELQ
ncbi:adenosine kinase-like [Sitophilus oryzae]|uniref:Adenosine kinase n=1 Tax=Sitophilus oryzae TaxID=7048 RepID=A0A6J2YMP8_SITOR|nr:adenosine kinase-like [Sitophilus oryzae]